MNKTKSLLISALVLMFGAGLAVAPALANETSNTPESVVASISLHAAATNPGVVEWSPSSVSTQGFKVVWSKNQNPTYPCREGDQYHYYSNSDARRDTVDAFSGNGTYYVRVCEYLGGKCGKYSNQVTVTLGEKTEVEKPEAPKEPVSVVSSIVLKAASTAGAGVVEWVTSGRSAQGFKVVWSKNENPTYPLRDGDRYNYYDQASANHSTVGAFNGAGVYYVRVCEYLGGKCGKYSNQIVVQLGENVKSEPKETPKNSVTAIKLAGEGNNVKWESNGFSAQGYKVVWSKNENPTYPTREGDQYHFRSNPEMNSDYVMPFAGAGVYYVRVCEYLGGACGVYSNQISVTLGDSEVKATQDIAKIQDSAKTLYDNKLDQLLAEIKSLRDLVKEQQTQINHLMKLKEGLAQTISSAMETAIKNFIAYGSDANTKKLGEGERAAVMYSFKDAFGKLPETQDEIEEAIKIANGRFPSIVSEEAEANAKAQFKKIYLRDADVSDAHDLAAIKVMAYGLRQKAENRNLKSESNALKTFKAIYKKLPQTTEEWNALQAITYSGATREQ